MPRLRATLWLAVPLTALLSLALFSVYFEYRIYCIASAQLEHEMQPSAHKGRQSLITAWCLLAFELLLTLPNSLLCVLRAAALNPPVRKRLHLVGECLPRVDVLITCCNEDLQVITDTVRAACALDYPKDSFRIFVSDDGASAAVDEAVLKLRNEHANLFYTARRKGILPDYKAGNLNHVLRYSASEPIRVIAGDHFTLNSWCSILTKEHDAIEQRDLSIVNAPHNISSERCCVESTNDRPPVEYIACLDADMLPEPNWLRSMLPHMMNDPSMALVCPPQLFYDVPKDDTLSQSMSPFAGITETIHDALGHADCLGSGYIVRRSALESIGGFPVESLSEDLCCSAMLLGAGWRTAFVSEALQYGSVPESFVGHIKQRTRWFIGHLQTAILLKLRLRGQRTKELSTRQRLVGLCFDLRIVLQIPLAITYIVMPLALVSGTPMVFWSNRTELRNLAVLVSAFRICHWIHQAVMGMVAGSALGFYDARAPARDAELEQWLSPYIFMAFVRSYVLPRALGGAKMGFTPSGSMSSQLKERDRVHRAPLGRRLRVMLYSNFVLVHLVFITVCIAGVVFTIRSALAQETSINQEPGSPSLFHRDQTTYLITRIAWPPIFWLEYVVSAFVPIAYGIWPPSNAPRESLLDRDPTTQVAYPTMTARKESKSVYGFWRYIRPTIVMVHTLVLMLCYEFI